MTATTMPTPSVLASVGESPASASEVGEALAERGAGEGAGQHADQRDADLDGGQEASGVGAERQRATGAADVTVDHRLQARGAGGDNGQFRHGQQAVHADQNDDNRDFKTASML